MNHFKVINTVYAIKISTLFRLGKLEYCSDYTLCKSDRGIDNVLRLNVHTSFEYIRFRSF